MVVAVTGPRHAHIRAHLQYVITTDTEVDKLRKLTTHKVNKLIVSKKKVNILNSRYCRKPIN